MSNGAHTRSRDRHVTPEEIADYQRDGAVLLSQALSPEWVSSGASAMAGARGEPDTHLLTWHSPDGKGESWIRYLPSRNNPEFRRFALESPIARLAAELMVSSSAIFTGDLVFSKEPGTVMPTGWHQDSSGMPVSGNQHCVMWIAFEPVARHLALEFVRGSHLWGVTFMFKANDDGRRKEIDCSPMPDIENHRSSFDIIGWETQPGDIVAFHISTLHGARGGGTIPACRRSLSMRWAGDDVRYTGKAVPISFPTDDWAGLKPGDRLVSQSKPQVWPALDLHGGKFTE